MCYQCYCFKHARRGNRFLGNLKGKQNNKITTKQTWNTDETE